MEKVSTERALEILGLDPGATVVAIDERFHALAIETHPDHGGSAEDFTEVLAARDRLKEGVARSDLVSTGAGKTAIAVSPPSELATIERERDVARKCQEKSERVTKGLVRAEVSRLTRSRRRASFLAWLGGGAGALTIALRATDSTGEFYLGFSWIAPVLIFSILLGSACAIASFSISDQISRIEQAIEDAAETMAGRSTFLDLMYEIVDAGEIDDRDAWTSSELVEAVDWWSRVNARRAGPGWGSESSVPRIVRIALLPFMGLRRIARWSLAGRFDPTPSLADLAEVIGSVGFVRLLIAKGEETGLLVIEEEVDDDRLLVMHRLAIEPVGGAANPA